MTDILYIFRMTLGNLLLAVVLAHYIIYVVSLLDDKKKEEISTTNEELERLRNKSDKTLEEQKRFLELKYPPKRTKTKFDIKNIGLIIVKIVIFLFLFRFVLFGFNIIGLELGLGWTILIIFLFSMIINTILSKFNLHNKTGFFNMIRGGRKR